VAFTRLYESVVSAVINKKLTYTYRRDSARCGNGHSGSVKVICYCANRRGIHVYDFLL